MTNANWNVSKAERVVYFEVETDDLRPAVEFIRVFKVPECHIGERVLKSMLRKSLSAFQGQWD